MDDLISRQAAIDAILDCCPSDFNNEYECGYYDGLRQGVHRLKHLPSAEVEPVKHGKWTDEGAACYCSVCGRGGQSLGWKFCPWCGAKMEERKEE